MAPSPGQGSAPALQGCLSVRGCFSVAVPQLPPRSRRDPAGDPWDTGGDRWGGRWGLPCPGAACPRIIPALPPGSSGRWTQRKHGKRDGAGAREVPKFKHQKDKKRQKKRKKKKKITKFTGGRGRGTLLVCSLVAPGPEVTRGGRGWSWNGARDTRGGSGAFH